MMSNSFSPFPLFSQYQFPPFSTSPKNQGGLQPGDLGRDFHALGHAELEGVAGERGVG
jgi:hypothetical protein